MPQSSSSGRDTGEPKELRLYDRLGLISLIDEGMRLGLSESPVVADLFSNLWDLVSVTVTGSKIDRLKPEQSLDGFRMIEVNADTGENLGRLNMIYLNKPIPCYYLVYVEVAAPFRRKGLGNRILEYFRDFLKEKSAVGILDNIIPEDDPTYGIYFKQAWEPIEAVVGEGSTEARENYMIYVPPGLADRPLKEPVLRLLHHLKRKRAAIDMRDNEVMVGRTIAEFREVYSALLAYFAEEIKKGKPTPLMRFMFTRFVTKLIAFRRRISELLGYTGGDSLEQIVLSPEIAALPIQSYAPRELASKPSLVTDDDELISALPEDLKEHPAPVIESLPNYERPSLVAWWRERGLSAGDALCIGDLMDLGFDPTRLKEIKIGGQAFIFERIQARQLPDLEKKRDMLSRIASDLPGARVRNAQLKINPPLLSIRDRGNAYVLRRKIGGIHWEEALEQLQSSPLLKGVNASIKVDRLITASVRQAHEKAAQSLNLEEETIRDMLTCFVSWDLAANQPKLVVDFAGSFLESVWMS